MAQLVYWLDLYLHVLYAVVGLVFGAVALVVLHAR